MAPHLTKREDEIRRLVLDGLTNEAIAARLGISARTVEAHLRMLFRKTGASRRDELSRPVREAPAPVADPAATELLEQQVHSYEAVLRRLVERQFSLFEERVEMTLVIGSRPGEDMVVERHWTTPIPYLVYRVIRPITPTHVPVVDVSGMSMTCDVVNADVNAPIELVADSDGGAQAVVLFQPGLQDTTEWVLRYRTPGMWDPLRARGRDVLTWTAGPLDGRHPFGLDDMVLRVEFPAGTEADLVEKSGAGVVERVAGGPPSLVFRDSSGTGGIYRWELRMATGR